MRTLEEQTRESLEFSEQTRNQNAWTKQTKTKQKTKPQDNKSHVDELADTNDNSIGNWKKKTSKQTNKKTPAQFYAGKEGGFFVFIA